MNPQSACHIAPAGHADVPEILAMVRELAEFEHLLHEAVASRRPCLARVPMPKC